jgi:hypothetical protein
VRAITVSQPWADFIRSGQKVVENRFWSTSYRGPLAIHAGKGTQYLDKHELKLYDTSCIVAVTELVACVNLDWLKSKRVDRDELIEGTRYTIGEILDHKFTEGPYLWILQDTRAIKPVPMRGAQGLWKWEPTSELEYVEFEMKERAVG